MDAMDRRRSASLPTRLALVAGVALALLLPAPASGASACAQRVIDDWSDNGRVDRVYRLQCYQQALDAIPVDLRDYTNAADVIERALSAAARQQPPGGGGRAAGDATFAEVPGLDASSASSVPLPLILIAAFSALVLVAGAVGHLSRRRRGLGPRESTAD